MTNVYQILEEGVVVNTIKSSASFMEKTYAPEDYALVEPEAAVVEHKAKTERNRLLAGTDKYVPLTDHPQHAAYMAYRQALRDWPEDPSFPDTLPTPP